MIKEKGEISEVFIPNSNEDVMQSKKVGFKVKTEKETLEIIQEVNEYNATILKDDKVLIIRQTIHGKSFIDIEKIGEENYE